MPKSLSADMEADLRWACRRFLGSSVEINIDETEGGVNNIVRKVTIVAQNDKINCLPPTNSTHHTHSTHTKAGAQYIVRVYNTNTDDSDDEGTRANLLGGEREEQTTDKAAPSPSSSTSHDSRSKMNAVAKVLFEHAALSYVGKQHHLFGWKVPVPVTQSYLLHKAKVLKEEHGDSEIQMSDAAWLDKAIEDDVVIVSENDGEVLDSNTAENRLDNRTNGTRTFKSRKITHVSINAEIVRLPITGLLASVFPLLPGGLPGRAFEAAFPIGKASGELSVVLRSLNLAKVREHVSVQMQKTLSSSAVLKKPEARTHDTLLGERITEPRTVVSSTQIETEPADASSLLRSKPKLQLTPTPPYFDLYAAHERMSSAAYHAFMAASPDLLASSDPCRRADCKHIIAEMRRIEATIAQLHALGLPEQAIHGDLHYDNVLAESLGSVKRKGEGKGEEVSAVVAPSITALLDFEFIAFDWRAMELAICLSKYVSEPDPLPHIKAFIAGWRAGVKGANERVQPYVYGGAGAGDGGEGLAEKGIGGGTTFTEKDEGLTSDEVASLASLVKLRILSNTVFFIGRAMAGEDSIETLSSRLGAYVKRLRWLDENEDSIKGCFA